MSNAKHTPEPWIVRGDFYCGAENYIWSEELLYQVATAHDSQANADRIVACVNACAGINPEAIPDLVATLNSIIEWWEDDHDFPYQGAKVDPGEACQWYKRRMYLMAQAARAVLAKVKGGES